MRMCNINASKVYCLQHDKSILKDDSPEKAAETWIPLIVGAPKIETGIKLPALLGLTAICCRFLTNAAA